MSSSSTGLEGSSDVPNYGWSYTGNSKREWIWKGPPGDPNNGKIVPYPGYPKYEGLLAELRQEGHLKWLEP